MSAKYVRANDDDAEVTRKLTKSQKYLRFLYNQRSGECMGRLPRSWAYLAVYFLIFYAVLSCFFLLMMHIFLNQVIKLNEPLRTGENSLLEFIPGVNVNPRLSVESSLIISSSNETSATFNKYRKAADKFFNNSFRPAEFNLNGVNCSDNKTPNNVSYYCIMDKELLGPCANPVNEARLGRLCVYIRINKIFGWIPDVENENLSNDTLVHCEGVNPGDKNNLGKPVFYPSFQFNQSYGVISNKYFPFISQKNYSSPMVAVQFPSMTYDLVIIVQCSLSNLKKVSKPIKFEIMFSTTL